MYKTSLIVICIQCIQAVFVLSDLNGRPTRGLSMLRMGKRNLSFLRMGRSYLPPLVPPSYDLPGEDINERQLMGAPRMGKDIEDYDIPRYHDERAPPVPRLGFYDEYINEIRRELASNPEDLYNNVAHSGRYLGRQKRSTDTQLTEETADKPLSSDNSDNVNKEKRALPRYGLREVDNNNNPFPRLGLYERENPFPRLGLYERATFPRLGLREEDEDERSVPMMPRLGLRDSDLLNTVEAEERALPRYGLRNAEEEKRAMSMLRMGKREEEITPNEEKRKMSMLRMGKRKMSMLRMGKRGGMSMLRMGRSQTAETPEEKRAMSMLRMGRSQPDNGDNVYSDEQKRAMSMLRMGKRKMSMLRMGRSYSDSDKRAMSMLRMGRGMSMLRMGRSSPDMEDQNQISSPEEQQKRAMSMLRMGRGMSMLRMGRSANDKEEMKVTDDKRGMSMLRMGKKDETKSES